MSELKGSPLRRTRALQAQLDEFLDVVSQAALSYEAGMTQYVRHGWTDAVEEKMYQVREYESRGDRLRSEIGTMLVTEMLLPDTVGDVLSLLVALDHLLDVLSVVIKRSTVYASLSVILGAVYFAAGLIMSSILPVSEFKEIVTNVVSVIVMVLTFISARESIQHFIENRLFHTRYSHPEILSNSTVMFSSIHDLNGLLHFAIQYLYDSVGIEKIAILIKDEESQHYTPKVAINFPPENNLCLLKPECSRRLAFRE